MSFRREPRTVDEHIAALWEQVRTLNRHLGGSANDHGELEGLLDPDHPQYVAHALASARGDLLVGAEPGVFQALLVGPPGSVPVADPTQPQGIRWQGGSAEGEPEDPFARTETKNFTYGGSLAVEVADPPWYPSFPATILSIRANLAVTSSSGVVTFNVLVNGASVLGTDGTVAVGDLLSPTYTDFALATWAADDYLEVEITGAGVDASYLVVDIEYQREAA